MQEVGSGLRVDVSQGFGVRDCGFGIAGSELRVLRLIDFSITQLQTRE